MTKVVHCKKEPYDVLIDRRGKWGNPFRVDVYCDRETAIKKYEDWLLLSIEMGHITKEEILALDGKTLGCWCHPQPCHGDVIVKVINMIKLGEI